MEFTKTPGWLDWYTGPSKPRFQHHAAHALAVQQFGQQQPGRAAADDGDLGFHAESFMVLDGPLGGAMERRRGNAHGFQSM